MAIDRFSLDKFLIGNSLIKYKQIYRNPKLLFHMVNVSSPKTQWLFIANLRAKIDEVIKLVYLLYPLVKPSLGIIFVNYSFTLLQTFLEMLTPKYTGGIIDIVTRSKDEQDLKELVIKMLIFSVVTSELQKLGRKVSDRANLAVNKNLRSEVYKRVLECDMEYFDEVSTTEATQMVNNGVEGVIRLCIMQVTNSLEIFVGVFGNLYLMYSASPQLAFIVLVMTPAKFVLSFFSVKQRTRFTGESRELQQRIWRLPMQAIQNIGLVKCFSTEKEEHEEFKQAQQELYEIESQIKHDKLIVSLLNTVLNEGLRIVLIWFGGVMVFQGQITPGELSTFNMYATSFTKASVSIKSSVENLIKDSTRSAQLLKVVRMSSTSKLHNSRNITKPTLRGAISINNVSFCYPAKPTVEVLHNINLDINEGETVAFVGISGSGKTTLAYLLQNLYTPTQGRIFIGGEDIRDYDISWLHHQMGYVSQEPILFDKTVEQNIIYGLGGKYTPEQLQKSLEHSNSTFILSKEKFPDGLKTRIGTGPNTVKLSGGQKQRIAIARAFIKDPKILILDEPTSALDGESESQVQKAIDDLTSLGDRTIIVIAHRLSTIIKCQKIIVFENGRIVEQGSHKELIEKNGAYKKLFEFQLEGLRQI